MSIYRLVGVTTPQAADRLIANGATLAGEPLHVTRYPGLAALQVRAAKAGLFTRRKEALEQVVQFQRQLEAAQVAGPVIPAAFANPLLDETEALRVLAVGHARLSQALEVFTNVRQYQIVIAWNPPIAVAHCATQGSFREALLAAGDDPVSRARAIQALMEAERARLGAAALTTLRSASLQLAQEPLGSEAMLVNAVVLVDTAREATFDAALEDVDASFPDLSIKQLGPLPPVSFASITIARPKPSDIARAKVTLNLDVIDTEMLREAYRAAMKRAHPDMAGGHQGRAAAITEAYRLLQRLDEANAAGGDRVKPILVDLVTTGGERWAA
jgi:Gas vesicle synthesis protein GvpL/GvpF